MTDPTPNRDDDPTDLESRRGSTDRAPRWVRVFGIIGLVLVILLVVLQFVVGGHGPGRHFAPSGAIHDPAPSDGSPGRRALGGDGHG